MRALLDGFRALGPMRLGVMGLVSAALLALFGLLALHGGGGARDALLYGDLDPRDSARMTETLDKQHIGYRLEAGGATLLVAPEDVARARVLLARDGLPSGGSVGYEIFDKGEQLTSSQFEQRINQTRALEGEIGRTIASIAGVRAARVHIVLPHREPFARAPEDAQASVMLTMSGAARLDREGVQAVLNLVAAAVPGLTPRNVTIVDSRGSLLARAGEPTGPAGGGLAGDETRHAAEERLGRAVEDLLGRTLGPGHVRAEATVEMDFARLSETEEKFDPDGQVPRSTQTTTSSSKSTEKDGTVSVQNNLPNADAGAAASGSQDSKQEETTNYEVGHVTRTTVREVPRIARISMAVLVDGIETPGPGGTQVWQPRPEEELQRLTALVRGAIGYDEKRGDRIEVTSLRFAAETAGDAEASALPLGLTRADLMPLARTALFGTFALVAVLLLLRPTLARLAVPAHAGALQGMAEPGSFAMLPPALAALATTAPGAPAALAGPSGATVLTQAGTLLASGAAARNAIGAAPPPLALPAPDHAGDELVSLASIDGQMRASSLRRLSDLVDRHPEESMTILRGWLAGEPAA